MPRCRLESKKYAMRQEEPANHVKMDSAHRNYIICSIELAPGRAFENHLDDSRRDGLKESATATERKENANAHYRTSVHFLRSSRKCRIALQFPEMSPFHRFTVSPSHRLTVSPSHRLTVTPSHRLTVSPSHRFTVSRLAVGTNAK